MQKERFIFGKLTGLLIFVLVLSGCNRSDKGLDSGFISPSPVQSVGQIHEHTNDYVIYADYPIFGEANIDSQIKEYAEQEVEDYKSSLHENISHESKKYDSYDYVKSEMHFSYRVPLINNKIVVIEFDEHNNRGSGPAYDVVNTIIFDRSTGEEIGLIDFFDTDTNFLPVLSSKMREKLEQQLGKVSEFKLKEGVGENIENFSTFELLPDKEVEFIFEPGQVAAESEGVIRVIIPLGELDNITNQDVMVLVYGDSHEESYKSNTKSKPPAKEEVTLAPTKTLISPTAVPTKKPEPTVETQPQSSSGAGCNSGKCIAITFDDGPAGPTSQLLDTLKEKGIKATFFQLGKNVSVHRDLVARMVNEGHQIGMHSWDHPQLTRLSSAEIEDQFNRTHDVIGQAAVGYDSQLVRPPYGAINQTVKDAIPHALILWSVDPEDWKDRNSDTVFQRVTSETGPGAIVLSHDIHQTTVDAYPRIIDYFKDQGYEFVTVGELLGFEESGYPSGGTYSHK